MTTESKPPILEKRAKLLRIRVRKEDAAYVYSILEANEGIAAYSTLEHRVGEHHRDLELTIPLGFITEVDELLETLKTELKGELYVLDPEPTSE